MKKQFVTFCAVLCFVCSVATVNAQQKTRLQINTYGFQNEDDALLAITQYTRGANPNVVLVRSNPDQILEISARAFMFKSWTQYDRAQVRKNAQTRTAVRVFDSILGNVQNRTRSRVLNDVIYQGRSEAYREAYRRQDNEQVNLEKWRGEVRMRLTDARTRQIIMESAGENVIVVENRRRNYAEPQLILIDGDLSAIGIQQGDNLDGSLRQVLALAAFYDANNQQNILGGN